MKICVCGLGKVGLPILQFFEEKGHEVIGYDIDRSKSQTTVAGAVEKSDACVFIVQTPSLPDGSFSNQHVLRALTAFSDEVERQHKKDYLYIIGSTVVPGSCDQFTGLAGSNLVYKPEFIRLEHVHDDLRNPSFILIGAASACAGQMATEIYTGMTPGVPVKRMTLVEAELAKITLNCALTMKISLANQLHLVAEKLGADSEVILDAVGADPRIGSAYLEPGRPYGGPCLPRDNRMFGYVARRIGMRAPLSLAADEINYAMEQRQASRTPVARALL